MRLIVKKCLPLSRFLALQNQVCEFCSFTADSISIEKQKVIVDDIRCENGAFNKKSIFKYVRTDERMLYFCFSFHKDRSLNQRILKLAIFPISNIFFLLSLISQFMIFGFFESMDYRFLLILQSDHFIFVMEEGESTKVIKQLKQTMPTFNFEIGDKPFLHVKAPKKIRKDHLKQKKKLKGRVKGDSCNLQCQNQLMILNFEKAYPLVALIQTHSDASKETGQSSSDEKRSYPLEKLLKKPNYISVPRINTIVGHFGHATALFKRPILQGQYFIEFIYKDDKIKNRNLRQKPSVRFGICNHSFNCAFPLGSDESVAYKSSDGSIVYNGQIIHKGQSFQLDDLIGVFVNMSPPQKHPDPKKARQNSFVTFYKNGRAIFTYQQLKQTFYCFAVSTYNYSQIQIGSNHSKCQVYQNGKHYYESLRQRLPYRDLEESGIFKI